jgi:RNA polymerase sigma-70 factor (ECF subfamily)
MDTSTSTNSSPKDETGLEQLIVAIRAGDQPSLSRLYDLTVDRVYGLARSIADNESDAEEIVCEVYARVWEQSAGYDANRGSVLAWLLVMCRSRALDLLRQQRSQRHGQDSLSHASRAREEIAKPDEILTRFQESSVVRRALRELEELPRQLIALAYFKGMTHQDIAVTVDLPLGTVKSHIRRSLKTLREYVQA